MAIQSTIERRYYRFTLHAAERLTIRHISVREIEESILSNNCEVIEDYPDDPRGSSYLIMGVTNAGRPLHVQCTYPPNLAIVTAYEPSSEEWTEWRQRKDTKL